MSSAIDRPALTLVLAFASGCGSRSVEPPDTGAAEAAVSDSSAETNDPRCPSTPLPSYLNCTVGPYDLFLCRYPCGMESLPAMRVNTQCIDKRDGRGGHWQIVQSFYDCPWPK